ncbi:MAG: glycosyltransferase N-terminal domain-containing protein [Pseudomonadota bacterium]
MTFGLALYRATTALAAPWLGLALRRRASRGKEDAGRLSERTARNTVEHPGQPLIWMHGASVGESRVLLALADALAAERAWSRYLFTSQTRTSADMLAAALPPAALHLMAPLDTPGTANRFIKTWRPALCIFAEGEIWPNLLSEARRAGSATALVNARMTERSLSGWERWPATAANVLGGFDVVLASDSATAARLSAIRGRPVEAVGNLKACAAPPAADDGELAAIRNDIAGRHVLLAASTHPGEEALALDSFAQLRRDWPGLVMIIAPRHPERGAAVATLAKSQGFDARRRTCGGPLSGAEVYVADTIGEMGLWYRIADAVYLGGGHAAGVGGHNPLEPLQLGKPIATGPSVFNFAGVFDGLSGSKAVQTACTGPELAGALDAQLRGQTPPPETALLETMTDRPMRATLAALLPLLDARS